METAPGIREGVNWNAPSFRTTEYFATTNLREKDGKDLARRNAGLAALVRGWIAGL